MHRVGGGGGDYSPLLSRSKTGIKTAVTGWFLDDFWLAKEDLNLRYPMTPVLKVYKGLYVCFGLIQLYKKISVLSIICTLYINEFIYFSL